MPNINVRQLSNRMNLHRIYPTDYPQKERLNNLIFCALFALFRGIYWRAQNVPYIRTTVVTPGQPNEVTVQNSSIINICAELFHLDKYEVINDTSTNVACPILPGLNANNYGGLRAFIARSGNTLFILHHGLAVWNDALQALMGRPGQWPGSPNYRILDFFSARALSFYNQLNVVHQAQYMAGIENVFLFGHSAGGAICQLLAHKLRQDYPTKRINCSTFGAPRLGNRAWVDSCDFPHTRTIFPGDPVPRLAPTSYIIPPTLGLNGGNIRVETNHYHTDLYADRTRPAYEWSDADELLTEILGGLRVAATQGRGSFGMEHSILYYGDKINPGHLHERKPHQRARDISLTLQFLTKCFDRYEKEEYGFPVNEVPPLPEPRWEITRNA